MVSAKDPKDERDPKDSSCCGRLARHRHPGREILAQGTERMIRVALRAMPALAED